MALEFARERAQDLWGEIIPLLIEHKAEIAHYPDIELDPDVAAYNACEDVDLLRCYTARMNGALIGYACFFVKRNMHYRRSLQALQDVLFVSKPHRHGRVGYKLIRFAESSLQLERVQVIFQHIKVNTPETIALFRKMDYEPVDVIMAKRLDR